MKSTTLTAISMLCAGLRLAHGQPADWRAQRDAEIREVIYRQNERIAQANTADEVLRMRSNRDVMIRTIHEKWERRAGEYLHGQGASSPGLPIQEYAEHLHAKTPAGFWTATVDTANGPSTLHLDLTSDEQGQYAGQIAEATQRVVAGLATFSFSQGKAVSFVVPALKARFDGEFLGPPRRSIVGVWEADGLRTNIKWMPQPKKTAFVGFRFADDRVRAEFCRREPFQGGIWRGNLARGGKNSTITISLGRSGDGSLTDWHFKIAGIPIKDVESGLTNVSFAVPAFNATCHLIREPANGLIGVWESRGRRDPISFRYEPPKGNWVAPEAADLVPFSRVTRATLEFANADSPASSYAEAIRAQNPYFQCDICSKAWRKKTMHEVAKGPCDGRHLRNPLYGGPRPRR